MLHKLIALTFAPVIASGLILTLVLVVVRGLFR